MNRRYVRRKRRQANMKLRSGGKFKINHKGRSGRTGSMFTKRTTGSAPVAKSVDAADLNPVLNCRFESDLAHHNNNGAQSR